MKGNEAMKSQDFNEAVSNYSKSIELDPEEPSTYCNRALVYLKLKDFSKALSDANNALKIKPDYLKAYHRRGKAYQAVNKLDLAIKDFQHILEIEPQNAEANRDLMAARKALNAKLGTTASSSDVKDEAKPILEEKSKMPVVEEKKPEPQKFVRVAI